MGREPKDDVRAENESRRLVAAGRIRQISTILVFLSGKKPGTGKPVHAIHRARPFFLPVVHLASCIRPVISPDISPSWHRCTGIAPGTEFDSANIPGHEHGTVEPRGRSTQDRGYRCEGDTCRRHSEIKPVNDE